MRFDKPRGTIHPVKCLHAHSIFRCLSRWLGHGLYGAVGGTQAAQILDTHIWGVGLRQSHSVVLTVSLGRTGWTRTHRALPALQGDLLVWRLKACCTMPDFSYIGRGSVESIRVSKISFVLQKPKTDSQQAETWSCLPSEVTCETYLSVARGWTSLDLSCKSSAMTRQI